MSDAASAALDGQAFAETLMQDACQIHRPPASQVLDEATLRYAAAPGALLYSGPCRISGEAVSRDSTAEAGDRLVHEQTRTISVPVAVTGLQVGDTVTVTDSVLDPDLLDRIFRIQGLEHRTYPTARRLLCEEMTA